MTSDSAPRPDLYALLAQANRLAARLLRGDLSAAEPLAEMERQLAALAQTVAPPRKHPA